MRFNRENVVASVRNGVSSVKAKAAATGTALVVAAGSASAQTGIDTTQIDAAIADVQTKGVAIATAVTLMVFLIAAAKWLRRAK